MFYLNPQMLRSRGGFDNFCTAGGSRITLMYYWSYDNLLYVANNNGQLFKCVSGTATPVTGPAENVLSIAAFTDSGGTAKLIIAEDKGAQNHTLHTYDGTTYAAITGTSVPDAEKVLTRFDRVFATGKVAEPDKIFFSEQGDETTWSGAYNEGGWVQVAPGHDGDIIDWIDFEGALYVFKEHAIYRMPGDHPQTWVPQKLMSSDAVIAGTAVDCAKGLLYATSHGVFPVNISSQTESEDLTRQIEQELQAVLSTAKAAFSPELGAYIIVTGATTAYVSNLSNRPDVWTKFTLTPTIYSIYEGNGLYIGASDGKVFLYNHDGYEDNSAAFTVSFKTGDWDLGEKLHRKEIVYLEGAINAKENATATPSLYADGGGTTKTLAPASYATTARNLSRCRFDCETLALGVAYTNLTAPCAFAGAAIHGKLKEAIL